MELTCPWATPSTKPAEEDVGVAEVAVGVAEEQTEVEPRPRDLRATSSRKAGLAGLPLCMNTRMEKSAGRMWIPPARFQD